jgi:hypothetical protein
VDIDLNSGLSIVIVPLIIVGAPDLPIVVEAATAVPILIVPGRVVPSNQAWLLVAESIDIFPLVAIPLVLFTSDIPAPPERIERFPPVAFPVLPVTVVDGPEIEALYPPDAPAETLDFPTETSPCRKILLDETLLLPIFIIVLAGLTAPVPIFRIFSVVAAAVAKLYVPPLVAEVNMFTVCAAVVVFPIDSVVVAPAKFMVVAAVFSKSKDGDEVVRLVSMIGLVKVFDQIGVFPAP